MSVYRLQLTLGLIDSLTTFNHQLLLSYLDSWTTRCVSVQLHTGEKAVFVNIWQYLTIGIFVFTMVHCSPISLSLHKHLAGADANTVH